ncbi:hypothetical protein M885DRAFT_504569 [Pelagophyceae sp. CCMP2097]|nr:hypothetical protein M885DRAFT_504569 [Pelagophyceae sp. CCMP2097]|mmetsp:Transcript_26406/g.90844  ORF Transcript_26406/g.90844 Transcript_26406/m.90844 type:complete len:272 (+) Transcript_26406:25-840(+)
MPGGCDRRRSRVARGVVREALFSGDAHFGSKLPRSCDLHPDRDVFLAHERAKKAVRANLWKCQTCGKQFRTEAFLDAHLEHRHADLIAPANATGQGVCLGDFCSFLDCPSYERFAATPVLRASDEDEHGEPVTRSKERKPKRRAATYAFECDAASLEAQVALCKATLTACVADEPAAESARSIAAMCHLRCANGRVLANAPRALLPRGGGSTLADSSWVGAAVVLYAVFVAGAWAAIYACTRDGGRARRPRPRPARPQRSAQSPLHLEKNR